MNAHQDHTFITAPNTAVTPDGIDVRRHGAHLVVTLGRWPLQTVLYLCDPEARALLNALAAAMPEYRESGVP